MGIRLAPAAVAAMPQLPADRGFLAWSYAPSAVSGSTALPTAGTLYLTRIRRVPAGPVTSISIVLAAAGVTLTSGQCFVALFTDAGVLAGTSADQSTAWTGVAGIRTAALAGGPYAHPGGDLYVGMWFNGTTGPTIPRFGAFAGMTNVGLAVPNFESATANTGLTTAAPGTLGTQVAAAFQYWCALS